MERAALQQALVPWLSLFPDESMRYTLTRDGCVDSAVIVAAKVTVSEATANILYRKISNNHLRRVREAIDLLYLALTLDPSLVVKKPDGTWAPVGRDMLALEVLKRGGAFILQIELLSLRVEDVRFFERLNQYFVSTLGGAASTDASYLKVRNELEDALTPARPQWRQQLVQNPVIVHYSIVTPIDSYLTQHMKREYVYAILDLIKESEGLEPVSWDAQADEVSKRHVPIKIDRVFFSLDECPVTNEVVEALKDLQSVRKGFAVCEHVRFEPAMGGCSHEIITKFLNAFSPASPENGIQVGGWASARTLEDEVRELCDAIIHGITNADNVGLIELARLMNKSKSPAGRRGIYRAMIEHLLSHSSPCNLLIDMVEITELDGQLLREEDTRWRSANPGRKLRVKKLVLLIYDENNSVSSALVDLLDGIEELVIKNHNDQIQEATVRFILNKFTGLRALDISDVAISSMDIFWVGRQFPLQALSLTDFTLVDRESIVRFIHALGDPTTPLALGLRKLHIGDGQEWGDVFRLRATEADELGRALETNYVLEKLSVFLYPRRNGTEATRKHFHSTAGRIIRAKPVGSPLAMEVTKRAAFLSVIHAHYDPANVLSLLDSSVVASIFGFAAPVFEREIKTIIDENDEVADGAY